MESFTTADGARPARGTVQGHLGLSDTGAGVSDIGNCDSWYCGDDQNGPSGMASCAETCRITGYVYKCYDNPCRFDF